MKKNDLFNAIILWY